MKPKKVLFIFLIISINAFATVQTSDILIIGRDTIFHKEFPLEQLELKYRPFGYGTEEKYFSSTNCWRGYKAIWKIIDNKLFLEKIIQCNNKPGEESIVEFFNKNGIQFQERDGMIFANWCTMDLYKMTPSQGNFKKERTLDNGWGKIIKRKILQIENGIVTINRL